MHGQRAPPPSAATAPKVDIGSALPSVMGVMREWFVMLRMYFLAPAAAISRFDILRQRRKKSETLAGPGAAQCEQRDDRVVHCGRLGRLRSYSWG